MCKWTRPFFFLGDRLPEGTQKPLPGPGSSSLQCWHWESSKVLAGLAFCELPSQYRLLFRGSAGVTRVGQQQFATQTLRVHLLGLDLAGHLDCKSCFLVACRDKRGYAHVQCAALRWRGLLHCEMSHTSGVCPLQRESVELVTVSVSSEIGASLAAEASIGLDSARFPLEIHLSAV